MFIAKNNDLIILAKDTREELEQALTCMVYTSIEETDIDYQFYNGEYLIPEEIEIKKREVRIAEIKYELAELDLKSIRPARAGETERLAELEAQAVELRKELQELTPAKEQGSDAVMTDGEEPSADISSDSPDISVDNS